MDPWAFPPPDPANTPNDVNPAPTTPAPPEAPPAEAPPAESAPPAEPPAAPDAPSAPALEVGAVMVHRWIDAEGEKSRPCRILALSPDNARVIVEWLTVSGPMDATELSPAEGL